MSKSILLSVRMMGVVCIMSTSLLNSNAWAQSVRSSDDLKSLDPPISQDKVNIPSVDGGARMNLAFQSIPVRALLQLLGETAGVNIVADDSVSGTMTINLKQATWQEALQVIARSKGLLIENTGGTLFVRSPIDTNTGNGMLTGAPMVRSAVYDTETIVLQYQKAEDVKNMLIQQGVRDAADKSSLHADPVTNQLLIQDTPERINQIRKLVSRIDKPGRQVLIEARIVEAEDSFARSLGAKLGFNDLSRAGSSLIPDPANPGQYIQVPILRAPNRGVSIGGSVNNTQATSGQFSGVAGLGQAPSSVDSMINFPAAALSGVDPATFAMSLFNSSMNRFINLEISALESDGRGKVVSNPRVVTSNNIKAIVEQGTEIPYQQTNALGATNTSFRKANLKLEVVPQIAPNGEILLDVDITKDSVGAYTNQGFAINTKHVKTQVKIDNGGTLVIGGIYQEDTRNGEQKVPLLGDLPVLGYFFKTRTKSTSKTELLVFLTPYILDARGNIQQTKVEKLTIDD